MNLNISRHFVSLGDRQVHYRRGGAGPTVLLLHQSPTSSRECEPLMRRLLTRHCVIAPDMPGYGASDPYPAGPLSIEMLADNLADFMDALDIDVAAIYGFHTGASLATAFARRHSARVSAAVGVGLMCLSAAERESLLEHYLPDFVPRWDGGHLAWLWSRVKDQSVFFPWYAQHARDRVAMDGLSPAAVDVNLPDWLRSGEGYRRAYAAAFRYRPEIDIPHLKTPHTIIGFATDPLFGHLERLPALPAGTQVVRCASAAEAYAVACDRLARGACSSVAPPVKAARSRPARSWQDYVTVGGIQLRVMRTGMTGAPLLVQHGAQSSVNAVRGLIDACGAERCVLAVELPGHGESDAHADAVRSVVGMAALLKEAVQALGISQAELVGFDAGAAIQTALAASGGFTVSSLSLIAAIDVTAQPQLMQGMLDSYADPEPADFFGGHLLRAWHMARDHRLFFPWYERRRSCAGAGSPALNPVIVQQSVTDSVLAGAAGHAARRAEIAYPLTAQVAALAVPLRFAAPEWSPRYEHSRALARACASAWAGSSEAPLFGVPVG